MFLFFPRVAEVAKISLLRRLFWWSITSWSNCLLLTWRLSRCLCLCFSMATESYEMFMGNQARIHCGIGVRKGTCEKPVTSQPKLTRLQSRQIPRQHLPTRALSHIGLFTMSKWQSRPRELPSVGKFSRPHDRAAKNFVFHI